MEALREILAVFSVDNSALKRGVGEGNKLVDQLKDGLMALAGPLVAAFSGAAVVGFARDLIEGADAASKLADQLGLGIVELQGWEHAADMSGVQTELLTMAFGKLQLGLSEIATKGTGPAAEALKALGIEAKDASGKLKSSGAVLEEVADAIQGMDADKRNAALMKLFGEQGAKLVPMLKGGSASVRALRDEVKELGFAFEDEFAAGAEEFNDNMTRLSKAGKGFLLQVLGPIMPELVDLSEQLVRGAKAAIPMVKQVILLAKNSRILEAAVTMLAGKALVTGIAKFGKFTSILKLATSAAFRFLLPLLLLEDLIVFLAGGKSKLGEKLDKWFGAGTSDKVRASVKELTDEVVNLFGRFKDEVLPALREFAAEVLDRFLRLKDEVVAFGQEWGPSILKVAVALGAATAAFKLTTAAMALWQLATVGATAAMSAYTAATVLWTLKAPLMKMLFGQLRIAAALFNAMLWANPAALIAALIVGALALVVAFWPQLSEAASKAWERIKEIGGNMADFLSGVWTEIKFGALGLAASISDAFAGVWNDLVAGAQSALKTVSALLSKVPVIGKSAAAGVDELAKGADSLKMGTDASEVVKGQLREAQLALMAEIEAKQSRKANGTSAGTGPLQTYSAPAPTTVTNVAQDVQNTTQVNVTVPPGTPATLANRVGAAAQRGAQEGSGRNLRATQDALVPRPAG